MQKTRSDSEKQMLQLKTSKLESLCRALQAELHSQKSASPLPLSAEEGMVMDSVCVSVCVCVCLCMCVCVCVCV